MPHDRCNRSSYGVAKRDLGRQDSIDVLNQRRRTISEQRVVKTWMHTKPVCALQKVHKQLSRIYWSTVCPIKMNLLVLIISANSDHIAFVADNVEEFKLLE